MMMKKLLLTFSMILLVVLVARADDPPLSFSWEGEPLADTVVRVDLPSVFEIIFYASVTNNTASDMTIKVFREVLEEVPGSINQICWAGLCFHFTVDTSSTQLTLAPGATTGEGDEFSGHYLPQNTLGSSLIRYTFYNVDNPDERSSIVVRYISEYVGLSEGAMKEGYISEVYPNPATHYVNIDYKLTPQVNNAAVKVINLLGEVVKETNIETGNNNVRLDISELSSGVYFYSVLINSEIYQTKKLVVQH